LQSSRIVLDPSRVAAQIVSGIGIIGGGVIFMRRDVVRGLTTAASVWLTAALGMACGAGLPVLAVATTIGHFVIMLVFPRLLRRLPRSRRTTATLYIRYEGGHDLLAPILMKCSELKFAIDNFQLDRGSAAAFNREEAQDFADEEGIDFDKPVGGGTTSLRMQIKGKRPVSDLIATLSGIGGIREVGTLDGEQDLD
ncbi:MAG TPA: MgtC/SapB family protein, partial [Rhodopila sp.]|nr:MgtC/SapB family protein [Rhodopila sp.]